MTLNEYDAVQLLRDISKQLKEDGCYSGGVMLIQEKIDEFLAELDVPLMLRACCSEDTGSCDCYDDNPSACSCIDRSEGCSCNTEEFDDKDYWGV